VSNSECYNLLGPNIGIQPNSCRGRERKPSGMNLKMSRRHLLIFSQVDSMRLWEQICANKILASVELILFLNKLDILDAKLKSGVQLARYITSYSDRPNETKQVARCKWMVCSVRFEYNIPCTDLRDVFIALHQQYSPKKRKMYPHLTCAIVSLLDYFSHWLILWQRWQDTNATSSVITQGQHQYWNLIRSDIFSSPGDCAGQASSTKQYPLMHHVHCII
jgi:hypothetical protein